MALTEIDLSKNAKDATLTPDKISINPADNFTFPNDVTATGMVESDTVKGRIGDLTLQPFADSATAIKLQNAAGSFTFLEIDSSTVRLNMNADLYMIGSNIQLEDNHAVALNNTGNSYISYSTSDNAILMNSDPTVADLVIISEGPITLKTKTNNDDINFDPNGTGSVNAIASDVHIDDDFSLFLGHGTLKRDSSYGDGIIGETTPGAGTFELTSETGGFFQFSADRANGASASFAPGANADVIIAPTGTGILNLVTKRITNVGDPIDPQDVATKSYTQSIAAGIAPKAASRAGTTGPLPAVTYNNGISGVGATLTANANGVIPTQDGITLVNGDRLLVKDQVSALENGIYDVTDVGSAGTPFILTRAADFDGSPANEVEGGSFTFVTEGTTQTGSGWVVIWPGTVIIGTDPINFTQFSSAGQFVAGNGIDITTNIISAVVDDVTINFSGSALQLKDGGITDVKVSATAAIASTKLQAAGADTQVQFNNTGTFGASSLLTWNGTSLSVGTSASINSSTGTVTTPSINTTAASQAIDVNNRVLVGASGNSVFWSLRIATDSGGVNSIEWGNRLMKSSTGVNSLDWQNRQLRDTAGNSTLNWATPGNVQLNTGSNLTLTGTTTGGSVTLTSGTGNGGGLTLTTGTGGSGTSGAILLTTANLTGSSQTSGQSQGITLTTGSNPNGSGFTSANGGTTTGITITSGGTNDVAGAMTGNSGNSGQNIAIPLVGTVPVALHITTGNARSLNGDSHTAGTSGSILISSGGVLTSNDNNLSSGAGGHLVLTTGRMNVPGFFGGNTQFTGPGGSIWLSSGDSVAAGNTANNSGAGGSITLTSGAASGAGTNNSGAGGSITLKSGDAVNNIGTGGSITLSTGNSSGSSTLTGGNVTLSTGTTSGIMNGGGITLTTANNGTTLTGGSLTLKSGDTNGSGQCIGGGITLTTGNSANGGTGNNLGGSLTLTTGNVTNAAGIGNVGGGITLTTGSTAGGTSTGGNITLTAFDATRGGSLFLTGSASGRGQIGIGTGSPAASASVDITSTTRGFLPPRMTTTQRDAIVSPATGLVIYNTTTNILNLYNGTSWTSVSPVINFATREVPSGAIDSLNTVFTLANTPTVGSEEVYLNGLLQNVGVGNDYTISGATITFTNAPITGSVLLVTYRY